MKPLFFLFATLVYTCSFADSEKQVKSRIDKVTVYLSGAQVNRISSIPINPGNSVIVFSDLEQGIDPKSIQASGNGSFTILDVKHKVKYPEANPGSKVYSKNAKEIRMLEDSILYVDYELEEVANKQDVLNTERNLLLNNKIIRGESKNDTLPQFKDALSFLRERLNNINAELLKLKKQNYKLTLVKNRIQLNLNELRAFEQKNSTIQRATAAYQVHVTVSAEVSTQANLSISYLLYNAGWTPSYDLRTQSTTDKMQLTYKANVYQSTGVDWSDVKLTLSTNSPQQNNTRPVLTTYFLNYFQRYTKYKKRSMDLDATVTKAEKIMQQAPASVTMEVEAMTTADHTTMTEKMLNFEYSIKLNYSIPSDGQSHIVAVQNKDIPATFEHFAIPKLDNHAFLLAKMSGWEDLNLIPGAANVFFDKSFVGETFIDPDNTEDTLELSVGRDKSIVMKRIKLKDNTKEKILADVKVQTVTYEITLRNTKSVDAAIVVEDQIPVSQVKEIKVSLKESSGATYDESTGKLSWKIKMKPKESRKLILSYEVSYPKDKLLSGL